jgi:hypothetical protein
VFDPESEERFRMSEEAEAAAAAGEQPASVG